MFLGISGMEQIKDRRAETPDLYAKITAFSLNELCESGALLLRSIASFSNCLQIFQQVDDGHGK